MKLLEYEGKALLARHGVPVPAGALWPEVPESASGWMVKAQVLAGGRGKRGGIRTAQSRSALEEIASAMKTIRLGDEPVRAVYVEPRLAIAHEYYLAAWVNRDAGQVSVMASPAGGMEIETVPMSQIASVDIDPLIGLAQFQVRRLRRALGLPDSIGTQFEDLLRGVMETLVHEDAELVEINPLARTTGDELVAADAKIVLDDDAVFRHPSRPAPVAWSADSRFMQRCRDLGVIGVDARTALQPGHPPAVALLGNGAGLTMATYDQVALSGAAVAGAIELHGALARGVEHTAEVIRTLFMLDADVYFVNAFYQLRSTDALAQALLDALASPGAPPRERIVVRMRGVNQETSQRMMCEGGCFHTQSLREATQRVMEMVRSLAKAAEG